MPLTSHYAEPELLVCDIRNDRAGTKVSKPRNPVGTGETMGSREGIPMVLPTGRHAVLRRWLATRGVQATELAGILVTGDLDALLEVVDAHPRLSAQDRQVIDEARALAQESPTWPELSNLGAAACELLVVRVLEQVCEALGDAGVTASPYEGLGVTWGHELLEAQVVLEDLTALYQRMERDPR